MEVLGGADPAEEPKAFRALLARAGAREVMTAAALLVVLGAALLMDLGGLSMAMGAFLAGVSRMTISLCVIMFEVSISSTSTAQRVPLSHATRSVSSR